MIRGRIGARFVKGRRIDQLSSIELLVGIRWRQCRTMGKRSRLKEGRGSRAPVRLFESTTNCFDLLLASLKHDGLAKSPIGVRSIVIPCSRDTSLAIQEPTPAPALCARVMSATGMSHQWDITG